jgi:hypothetical protein
VLATSSSVGAPAEAAGTSLIVPVDDPFGSGFLVSAQLGDDDTKIPMIRINV